jgi:hypothetical protein
MFIFFTINTQWETKIMVVVPFGKERWFCDGM